MPAEPVIEDEPEAWDESTFEKEVLDMEFMEHIVDEVVDSVVHEGGKTLYQHYLDEREIPYAVHKTTAEMMSMIQVLFLPRDDGVEAGAIEDGESAAFSGRWDSEAEPAAAPSDSWARGLVPTKVRIDTQAGGSGGTGDATTRTSKSSGRNTARSRKSVKSNGDDEPPPPKKKPASFYIQPLPPRNENKKPPMAANDPYLERRAKEELAKTLAVKGALEDEQAAATKKLFDGRSFAFGPDGKPFMVDPINAERITDKRVKTRSQIIDIVAPGHGADSDSAIASKSTKLVDRKPAAGLNVKKKSAPVDEFFQPASLRPSQLNAIKLKAGVMFTESGRSKNGPPRDKVPGEERATRLSQTLQQRKARFSAEEGGGDQTVPVLATALVGSAGASTPMPSSDRQAESRPPTERGASREGMTRPLSQAELFDQSLLNSADYVDPPPGSAMAPAQRPFQKVSTQQREDAMGSRGRYPRDRNTPGGGRGRDSPPSSPGTLRTGGVTATSSKVPTLPPIPLQ